MVPFEFKTESIDAHYDALTQILHVRYSGVITPEVTRAAYGWGFELAEEIGAENIYALISDFRDVTTFDFKNLRTATSESRNLNKKFDLSRLPVALVVKNMYQEQMVKVSMKMTDQVQRMKIVNTDEEALTFLHQFHGNRDNQPSPDEANSRSLDVD